MQAFLLACELGGRVGEVYSSPLSRAVQTAGAFSLPVTVIDGLAEQYAGEWDGLTFTEIRTRYPELYARRAAERYLPLPGSEPDGEALSRFTRAMDGILSCGAPSAVGGARERYTPVPGQPGLGHGKDTVRLLRGAGRRTAGAHRRPAAPGAGRLALPRAAARSGHAGARDLSLRRCCGQGRRNWRERWAWT